MGPLANLRRHGLLAVWTALALWVAVPALVALCPCTRAAVADAVESAPASGADGSDCCDDCCPPAAGVRSAKPAASAVAAVCPLKGADFSACAVVPGVVDLTAKLPHAVFGFVEPRRFLSGSQGPRAFVPDTGPPDLGLPRALARLVATRCHPVNAPPVS